MRCLAVLLLCALPLGCGPVPGAPDTAVLRPGQLGTNGDPDMSAINLAQWAFADASRTYGRPIEAARAAAALDYIAGELATSPRWGRVAAETQQQLLGARDQLRESLGVVPGASSQSVVDHLTAAADALAVGNQAGAVRELGPPVFVIPGEQVLGRLSNLPYLQAANVATMRAANELFDSSTGNDWTQ